MRDIVEDARLEAGGAPIRSPFAETHCAPDPIATPERYAKAIDDSRRVNAVYIGSLLWIYVALWAFVGFAGAASAPSLIIAAVENTRSGLANGSRLHLAGFLLAVTIGGLIVLRAAKSRLFGAFEIGAALGIAYYGFTEAASSESAVFGFLGGVIGVADGISRLLKARPALEARHKR